MAEVAIRTDRLSKRYRLGGVREPYRSLRESLTRTVRSGLSRLGGAAQGEDPRILWALRDVSFEIRHGDVVGIIGRNGAGKSTLLKILSRITEPTSGMAEVHGRVGSLLEVGTGFHPELTGRENVYLNGAILGMKRAEIQRKFDEIVSFAEIEKFIDTPVKRYSTGMFVRLAFSVAAHLEPDVLLVDEVLAVGDIQFQKKCLGKMEAVSNSGRTVLFVSHNMATISTLCPSSILLSAGQIAYQGPTQEAVSAYLAQFGAESTSSRSWAFEDAIGGEDVKIKAVKIHDADGVERSYFSTTEPIYLTIDYWVLTDGIPVNISFYLYDEQANWICSVGNYRETRVNPVDRRGVYRSVGKIPGNLLNSGRHTVAVDGIVHLSDRQAIVPECVSFETVDDDRIHSRYDRWGGLIKPELEWETQKLAEFDEPVLASSER